MYTVLGLWGFVDLSKDVKLIKVYLEDYERLNRLVGELQAMTGERKSFGDVIHELLKRVDDVFEVRQG